MPMSIPKEDLYAASPVKIRSELLTVHEQVRESLSRSGTWWTGAQRRAIALEARAARDCALCAERKAALSPFAIDGRHAGPGELAGDVVDVIHRIVTDPGRLARSWFDRVMAAGSLTEEQYVELVSVAVHLNALDLFGCAIGAPPLPLDDAQPGSPSGERPATARVEGAWVAQIPVGADGGDDWTATYGDREYVPQIARALSLVPAEVDRVSRTAESHYMSIDHVGDPEYAEPGRALDRPQMELIAARVSAVNECFY